MHEHVIVRILQHQQIIDQRHESSWTLGYDELGRLSGNNDFRCVGRRNGFRWGRFFRIRFVRIDHRNNVRRWTGFKGVGPGRFSCTIPGAPGHIQIVVFAVRNQRVGCIDDRLVGAVFDLAQNGFAIHGNQQRRMVTVDDSRR